MTVARLALVGFGKIARDQHCPAIAASDAFELVALVDPAGADSPLPCFDDMTALIEQGPPVDAVILCQPPAARFAAAEQALRAGLHVFLEKPPGLAPGDVATLAAIAGRNGRTLFTAWHSREAGMVEVARAILVEHPPRKIDIEWREDIRKWHPGQDWLLAPGGFGVFDPGINALSIVTTLVPAPYRVIATRFDRPGNRAMPTAAHMTMAFDDIAVDAALDCAVEGDELWKIVIATDAGPLTLARGGAELRWQGDVRHGEDCEYARLYQAFAEAIAAHRSEVDMAPLQIVADAFLVAQWREVAPFTWG